MTTSDSYRRLPEQIRRRRAKRYSGRRQHERIADAFEMHNTAARRNVRLTLRRSESRRGPLEGTEVSMKSAPSCGRFATSRNVAPSLVMIGKEACCGGGAFGERVLRRARGRGPVRRQQPPPQLRMPQLRKAPPSKSPSTAPPTPLPR